MNRREFLRAALPAVVFAGASRPLQAATTGVAELVRDAIRRQRVLRLRYGGLLRHVEPHAIGVSAGGHRALLAWQVEGGSRSDPPSGWRTFLLAELGEVTLTVRGFTPRPGYRRDRAVLRDIELEVAHEPDAATHLPGKVRG